MEPFIRKHIPEKDIALLEKIRNIVLNLPEIKLGDGETVSSHMLTRGLARFFPVKVCDGFFTKGFEHSWLETENGSIIDPHPPHTLGGPLLVNRGSDLTILSPWFGFYEKHLGKDLDGDDFLENCEIVALRIEETIAEIENAGISETAENINKEEVEVSYQKGSF